MNAKVIAGIIAGIALIILLPFALNSLQQPAEPSAPPPTPAPDPAPAPAPPLPNPAPAAIPEPPPAPIIWQGAAKPPAKPLPQYKLQGQGAGQSKASGPDLTAETLVGTAWEVSSPYGPVQVEVGPNGQAVFNHPMVGALQGTWNIQGNKVNVSASFMGQTQSISATVKGSTLSAPGQNIRRLR